MIRRPSDSDPLLRRVLNANFRLGTRKHADVLAQFAANPAAPDAMRHEALAMLRTWDEPSGRDRVLGMWRPVAPRSAADASDALKPVIASFANANATLRLDVGRLAAEYRISAGAPVLRALVDDAGVEPNVRAEAIVALADVSGTAAAPQVNQTLVDSNPNVRAAALSVVRDVVPDRAVELLSTAALEATIPERQAAIKELGQLSSRPDALVDVLRQWADGILPPETQLEALNAAEAQQADPHVAELLAKINATRNTTQPLDIYREALRGGDADRGRTLFFEKVALSCVRCHKVGNRGGEVGPELTRIGAEKERSYLLEAIVDPNKTIAKDFESVVLYDDQGRVHTGVLREETDAEITLIDANANVLTFNKDSIEERAVGKSAMPADLVTHLTKFELRDLVEYLSSLKGRFWFRRRPL